MRSSMAGTSHLYPGLTSQHSQVGIFSVLWWGRKTEEVSHISALDLGLNWGWVPPYLSLEYIKCMGNIKQTPVGPQGERQIWLFRQGSSVFQFFEQILLEVFSDLTKHWESRVWKVSKGEVQIENKHTTALIEAMTEESRVEKITLQTAQKSSRLDFGGCFHFSSNAVSTLQPSLEPWKPPPSTWIC